MTIYYIMRPGFPCGSQSWKGSIEIDYENSVGTRVRIADA